MRRNVFSLMAALLFLVMLSLPTEYCSAGKLEDVVQSGIIRVGTTGDYAPMSYLNPKTGKYEGIDAELTELIAESLGVKVEYVPTTWPTLTADMLAGKFDIALCGISRNFSRAKIMAMSDAYGEGLFGKTILCRAEDAKRFNNLDAINRSDVKVMINPGGTNEKFARANLKNAKLIVHQENAQIPRLIAEGKADIMITETVEAIHYVRQDKRLAAPLVSEPFTRHSCGILMQKGDTEWLNYINFVLAELRMDGTMAKLENQYLKLQ